MYRSIGLGRTFMDTRLIMLMVGAGIWIAAIPALAQTPGGDEIDWFKLGIGLFGGLALFLFGMEQMSEGLKAAAGETLKVILAKLTKNRFMGAFITAVLNSSSVTTVLVVGFILNMIAYLFC